MSGLYVVGGQQRHAKAMRDNGISWYKFKQGLILQVELLTESIQRLVTYVSPPELCVADEPAILFKCGTLQDDRLYVCTQTEVLIFAVPGFSLLTHVSLPCFNDVHHVRPTPAGTLLIANSGLDMVLEISLDGQVLREWSTIGEDPWARFRKEVDYRRVASTKPHRSHPNNIFFVDDEIWVTRFEQRDAICLTDPSRRIQLGTELVHDGFVQDGHIYFTTVNGQIVIANARTLTIEEVFDLSAMSPPDALLGWCRGIWVEGDKAWVGFSRLRLTKFRENVSWVRWGFKQHLPTRIACYDLVRRTCLKEIDVQAHGLDAIFSIFPAATSLAPTQPAGVSGEIPGAPLVGAGE